MKHPMVCPKEHSLLYTLGQGLVNNFRGNYKEWTKQSYVKLNIYVA